MKGKQFQSTTQIYLFLALGKDSLILIYGCFMSLLKRLPTLTSHQNKACWIDISNTITIQPPFPFFKYVMNIHGERKLGF